MGFCGSFRNSLGDRAACFHHLVWLLPHRLGKHNQLLRVQLRIRFPAGCCGCMVHQTLITPFRGLKLLNLTTIRIFYLRRLVFIGFRDPRDLRRTPFGDRYGVEILALATDYFVQGSSIRATFNWFNILGIVVLCGFVSMAINSGKHGGMMLLWCAITMVVFVIVGAVAMASSRVWLDIFLIPICVLVSCLVEMLVRWVDATPNS